ncbi:hypothetical protein [Agromyces sp. GXQ0307]|uniref:hypothetical protein n=1 Tax=Agromyces sp. GXQ0307 TaxID=3377835 RepID=UPI00383BA9D2
MPLVGIALAVAAVLAACAPTSTATPSAAPSTGATTPTPSPDTSPVAVALVVDGGGFEIVDSTGAVTFAHAWADEADPAVDALTEAFGAEPTTSFEDNTNTHFADYDVYSWPGLAFGDAVGLSKPRAEYFLPSWVRVETAAVGEVAVRSRSGVGVGSSVQEVAALDPVVREQVDAATPAVYRVDAVDASLGLDQLSPPAEPVAMVGLVADAADLTIVKLAAPELSWSPF